MLLLPPSSFLSPFAPPVSYVCPPPPPPLQNVHAPNERHRLSMYRLAQRAYVKLLLELGKQQQQQEQGPGADKTEL